MPAKAVMNVFLPRTTVRNDMYNPEMTVLWTISSSQDINVALFTAIV